jgi:alpha-beta hydrolase superfamily lysophospholipase
VTDVAQASDIAAVDPPLAITSPPGPMAGGDASPPVAPSPTTAAVDAKIAEATAVPVPDGVTLPKLRREQQYMESATADHRVNVIRWVLADGSSSPPFKGGIVFLHGYGHYSGLTSDFLAARLWTQGIASFAIDNVGHGNSEGLPGLIPSWDGLVTDVLHYAAVVRERYLTDGQPLFAYGESLGGGLALSAALQEPACFAGLLLFAPMVGVDPDMRPSWALEKVAE